MNFVFRVGLIIKGIDALFEVIGGILLTVPTKLARYILLLSQHEAFRHHTMLAGRLDRIAETTVTHASIIEAIYLIVHGGAKIILIGAIAKGFRWGYVGFIAVLSLFSVIEIGRALSAREIVTGIFALFDVVVVYVIYREYVMHFGHASSASENDSG